MEIGRLLGATFLTQAVKLTLHYIVAGLSVRKKEIRLMDREVLVERFAKDLDSAMAHVENGGNSASLLKELYEKYVASGVCKTTGSSKKMDEKSLKEMSRQRAVMERNLKGFERNAHRQDKRNKRERQKMIEENTFLMQEVNELRRENGLITEQLRAAESQIAFSKTRTGNAGGSGASSNGSKNSGGSGPATDSGKRQSMIDACDSETSGDKSQKLKRKRGKLRLGAALTQAARIERERQREHQINVLMSSMEEKEGIISMQSAELRTLRGKIESMILAGAVSKQEKDREGNRVEERSTNDKNGGESATVDMISRLKGFPQRTSKLSASTPVLPLARR